MKKAAWLVLLLVLEVPAVQAQGLGFGPLVGYFKSSDSDQGEFMGGGAIRLKLTPSFGIEGAIHYRQEQYGNGSVTVKSWPVLATGLFYFFPFLYGAVGAGWYNTTIDYNESMPGLMEMESETTQEFGWHFGGGLELPFGRKTKLFGDIRYVFLNYDFQLVPGSKELKSDFYIITVGLMLGL